MAESPVRTVVVSAVNLRKGGTLTILRGCLEHLSGLVAAGEPYRVVALVHRRSLCDYPGIEYIEMPWCIRSWAHRLWAEYVTMHRISMDIAAQDGRKVWLWLSMHDTTPRVVAERQEVYCHTSFPFLRLRARDWFMDPKIPLFAMLTKWAYRINVHSNDNIIVQQNWFADALSSLLGVPRSRFRVIPPAQVKPQAGDLSAVAAGEHLPKLSAPTAGTAAVSSVKSVKTFMYASTPDCHKNFETLCQAAQMLEQEVGTGRFKVVLTISGKENRYAKWLFRRWGTVESIDWHGFMDKQELFRTYASADCFVFPSRIETWGLPISEYIATRRAAGLHPGLLLSELPYAHETAGDAPADYFDPDSVEALKSLMLKYIER